MAQNLENTIRKLDIGKKAAQLARLNGIHFLYRVTEEYGFFPFLAKKETGYSLKIGTIRIETGFANRINGAREEWVDIYRKIFGINFSVYHQIGDQVLQCLPGKWKREIECFQLKENKREIKNEMPNQSGVNYEPKGPDAKEQQSLERMYGRYGLGK